MDVTDLMHWTKLDQNYQKFIRILSIAVLAHHRKMSNELGVIFVLSWGRLGCTEHSAGTGSRNSRLLNLQIKDLQVIIMFI